MSERVVNLELALVGILTLIPGLLEIMLPLIGQTYQWGKIAFEGDFLIWRGVILVASGFFYLLAINEINPIQKRAQAVLSSMMIWIVAGAELFSLVLQSIPGGGGRWLNTPGEFLSSYTGPFSPALFLLPISILLTLTLFVGRGRDEN